MRLAKGFFLPLLPPDLTRFPLLPPDLTRLPAVRRRAGVGPAWCELRTRVLQKAFKRCEIAAVDQAARADQLSPNKSSFIGSLRALRSRFKKIPGCD